MNRLASLASLLFLVLAPSAALAQQTNDQLAPPPPGGTDSYQQEPGAQQPPTDSPHAWPQTTATTTTTPPPAEQPYAPQPAPHPYADPPGTGASGTASTAPPGMTSAQAAELLEQQRRRKIHLIYVELDGGGHWLDMVTVSSSNFLPPTTTQTTGTAFTAGVAAGIRPIDFLSIGARASLGFYPSYNFGIAAAEVSLILPTQVVEAYIRAGFGYAWVGNANYMDPSLSMTTIYGFAFTSAIGLDIYLTDAFSIGAAFDVDVLNLSRQALAPGTVMMAGMVDLTTSGNAVGLHIGGHASLTLHFL